MNVEIRRNHFRSCTRVIALIIVRNADICLFGLFFLFFQSLYIRLTPRPFIPNFILRKTHSPPVSRRFFLFESSQSQTVIVLLSTVLLHEYVDFFFFTENLVVFSIMGKRKYQRVDKSRGSRVGRHSVETANSSLDIRRDPFRFTRSHD